MSYSLFFPHFLLNRKFWPAQVVLFCLVIFQVYYYSPLFSPLISNSWSIDEWSVRQSEYKHCLILKQSEGHSYEKRRRSCSKEAYGLPFFEFPDGKLREIIDYNVETFGTNFRP